MLVGLRRALFILCLVISPSLVWAFTYCWPSAVGGQIFVGNGTLQLTLSNNDIFNVNSQTYRSIASNDINLTSSLTFSGLPPGPNIGVVHVASFQPTLNIARPIGTTPGQLVSNIRINASTAMVGVSITPNTSITINSDAIISKNAVHSSLNNGTVAIYGPDNSGGGQNTTINLNNLTANGTNTINGDIRLGSNTNVNFNGRVTVSGSVIVNGTNTTLNFSNSALPISISGGIRGSDNTKNIAIIVGPSSAGSFSPGAIAISQVRTITANNGSFTSGSSISGVNTLLSTGGSGTLNLGHQISGSGIFTNAGIININTTNALNLSGSGSSSSGTLTLNSSQNFGVNVTNSGNVSITGSNILASSTRQNIRFSGASSVSGTGSIITIPSYYTIEWSNFPNFPVVDTHTLVHSGGLNITSGTIANQGGITNGCNTASYVNDSNFYGGVVISGSGKITAGNFTNSGYLKYAAGTDQHSSAGTLINTTNDNSRVTVASGITAASSGLAFGSYIDVVTTVNRTGPTQNSKTINIYPAGVFRNQSTFSMSGGSIGGGGTFTNDTVGTFDYTGGNVNPTTFNNQGTFNVNNVAFSLPAGWSNTNGTLTINGTGTVSGTSSASNQTLKVGSVSHLVNAFAVPGTFTNFTSYIAVDGVFNFFNAITGINVTLQTLVNGSMYIGNSLSGNGTIQNAGAMSIDFVDALKLMTGNFTNSNWVDQVKDLTRINNTTNSGGIYNIGAEATFTQNAGTFSFTGGVIRDGASAPAGKFTNSGTGIFDFNNASPTSLSITGLFTNSSTFNVKQNLTRASAFKNTTASGIIEIDPGKTFTNTGAFEMNGGFLKATTSAVTNGAFINQKTFDVTASATNTTNFTNDYRAVPNMPAMNIGNGFTFMHNRIGTGLNQERIFTNKGILNITGTFTGNGTVAFNSGSNTFIKNGGTLNVSGFNGYGAVAAFTNQGTTTLEGVSTITGTFSGTTGSVLNIGNSTAGISAQFSMTYPFSNIPTINLAVNGTTLAASQNITGVNTFTVAAGTTATFTAATFSGASATTSVINNSGTMKFNIGSSTTGPATFSAFNVLTGGAVEINRSTTSFMAITGALGNTGTSLTIAPGGGNTVNTGGTISNIRTVTVTDGIFNVNNAVSGISTKFDVKSGATATLTAAISGAGTIENTGTINFNTGSSVSSFSAFNVYTGGAITVGGTGVINMAITGATTPSPNTGTSFIVTPSTNYIVGGTISNIRIITVNAGANTFSSAYAITGVSTQFNLASGTATFTSTLSGTGTLDNSGTMNLNTSAAVSGFSAFNIKATGVVNVNGTATIAVPIIGTSGSILNIGTVTGPSNFIPGSTIATVSTISVKNGSMTLNNAVSGVSTKFEALAGTTVNINIGIAGSGTGTIENSGTMNLNSGSSVSGFLNTVGNGLKIINSGSVFVNGTATISQIINGSGAPNNTSITFNPSTSYTTAGAITSVKNITLTRGTFNANHAITGFTNFTVTTGTLNLANTFSGTGAGATVTNSDIINFNSTVGAANTRVASIGTISATSGSTLNFNQDVELIGTSIVGATNNVGTILNIADGKTLTTNAAIRNIKTINVKNDSGVTPAILTLNTGAAISSFSQLTLDGTLTINSGASFTVSTGDNITGNGSITNSGNLTIDGSNLTLGGNFTNTFTGQALIKGTPTLTFNGTDFINAGSITATFSDTNSLPLINVRNVTNLNLANGVIVIGYGGSFIKTGDYTLIATGDTSAPPSVGNYILPEASVYVSSWTLSNALTAQGYNVVVHVERRGFAETATDPVAKIIAKYLDEIGDGSPSAEMQVLLNALQQITDPEELNAALLELVSPEYVTLQSLMMMQNVLDTVHGRIFQARSGYASGDIDSSNGVWLRTMRAGGTQHTKNNLLGYTSRSNGIVLGIDNQINSYIMLGAAGSIGTSKVQDSQNALTQTVIKNYQAMIYGTVKSASHAYLDWMFSTGVNRYNGIRNISFTTFNSTAYSKYTGQQLSLKAIASKNYTWNKYFQLTPMASVQYSFLRQLAFAETDAGVFNRIQNPSNMNLLQFGVGGQFSIPLVEGNLTTIPEVHAMAYVDAKGGVQDNNSQFASGGPLLTTTVRSNKLSAKLGASLTMALNNSLQLVANYDLEKRRNYTGNMFYLDLRYVF